MRRTFPLFAFLLPLMALSTLASRCTLAASAPSTHPASAQISIASMDFDRIAKEQRDRMPPQAMKIAFGYLRDHADRVGNAHYVTIIDFDQPSTAKRMHVIDLTTGHVEDLLVAHAKNSGDNYATRFSNEPGSNMSSLGVYLTGDAITSPKHGPALLLHGQDKTNDNALKREIILHGADYVSEQFAKQNGRLGRSLGCPAVENGVVGRLVEELKGGSVMVIYKSDAPAANAGH